MGRAAGPGDPLWLPVYTPNLNLMERAWCFLKQKLACHRFWAGVEGLEVAATTLLDRLHAHFHNSQPPGTPLHRTFCQSA